jgi:hypothetical protein
MNKDFTPQLLNLACHFYSRAFSFPYDEHIHQLHHLLREIESYIQTEADNTIASIILDTINFYHGEEMSALQAEFARMYTPVNDEVPFISLLMRNYLQPLQLDEMLDELESDHFGFEYDDEMDAFPNVLSYFGYLASEDMMRAETFWETYLQDALLQFNKLSYDGATINFYKEAAKRLNELVFLLKA